MPRRHFRRLLRASISHSVKSGTSLKWSRSEGIETVELAGEMHKDFLIATFAAIGFGVLFVGGRCLGSPGA